MQAAPMHTAVAAEAVTQKPAVDKAAMSRSTTAPASGTCTSRRPGADLVRWDQHVAAVFMHRCLNKVPPRAAGRPGHALPGVASNVMKATDLARARAYFVRPEAVAARPALTMHFIAQYILL